MDSFFAIILNSIVFLTLIIIFAVMPYITRKNVAFGINIPSSQWNNDFFKNMRKKHLKIVLIAGLLITTLNLIATICLSINASIYVMMGLVFLLLTIYFALYISLWKKSKTYKKQMGWNKNTKNIMVADTSQDDNKKSLSPYWFVLYLIIVIGTLVIGYILYEQAPEKIPMNYDATGNVTNYAQKSMSLIYGMVGIQVFICVLFIFVFFMLSRSRQTVNPSNVKKSLLQNSKMRYRWSMFLYIIGLAILLNLTLAICSMLLVFPIWVSLYVPLIMVFGIIMYAIILAITTGQSGSRIDNTDEKLSETINKDDDSNWKLGSFYYNKDDPALFVEKRFGVGWTFNLGRWQGWAFIIVILAVVVFSLVISF